MMNGKVNMHPDALVNSLMDWIYVSIEISIPRVEADRQVRLRHSTGMDGLWIDC